ncbi:MAG: EutN/CcmL family microcompartment protein [Bdellovibrionota bacterium]
MQFAIVLGSVVATQKVDDLKGIALKVLHTCNEQRERVGDPFVAVDAVGARPGDLVLWVGKREASLAIPGAPLANNYPVDAAVTGIVDDLG